MAVDSAKVTGRRKLDYASYQDLLADADRIGSGPVRALGNWSAGQIFRHLALAYNASIDGFNMTFPFPLRIVARLFKRRLLRSAMPAGIKLPAAGQKALIPTPTSTEEGLTELRAAVARLQREPQRAPNPILGPITKEEWDQLHLKHASLHMSFLVPEG
jgi:hypothetical protein